MFPDRYITFQEINYPCYLSAMDAKFMRIFLREEHIKIILEAGRQITMFNDIIEEKGLRYEYTVFRKGWESCLSHL